MMAEQKRETSWEESEKWYDLLVGSSGHYYHEHVVLPGVLKLLQLKKDSSLVDFGCGQGILSRSLRAEITYHGIDLSPSLIQKARNLTKNPHHSFSVADITKSLTLPQKFSHAAFILSLQNVERGDLALKNAAEHLDKEGVVAIVLNHPCFRIPRQSAWGIDAEKKLQYRRLDRYMAPLKIPIQTHPGKGQASEQTWTFHHSLSDYSAFLAANNFAILRMEEWVSDKTSTGKNAKMENRARTEFPLFLSILAKKITN